MLQRIYDLVPENCRDNRQYFYSGDFIENREWNLAMDSFLELVEETKAIFPQEYWDLLSLAGYKLRIENIDDQIKLYRTS